ncbi:uncharacterized protein LOC114267575 [Camellia sinensis]|uniref:uncharacterized protein LOC114267575 n=1 Tax=Camellia sinensis TaxID=4442 RepID=UPI001035604A|nr:uncharacterized protein LOC114267575 [Camellia sinensis]
MGDISEFDLQLHESIEKATLFTVITQPTIVTQVVEAQNDGLKVETIRERISKGKEENGLNVYVGASIKLIKSAHFLAMSMGDSIEYLVELYVHEIIRLYGVPIDGQSKCTIQTLEDMLRAFVLDFKESWEKHLPLVEIAYNNSYQAGIEMAPLEALYGRPCKSAVCWAEVGDSPMLAPELVCKTIDKVAFIRKRLVMAQSHQKCYADRRRRLLSFEVKDIGSV